MKMSRMTAMLAAIIIGIIIIPAMVQAGGYHARSGWDGPRYLVSSSSSYPSAGYVGSYAMEEPRTIYRAPDVYETVEAPRLQPCEKSVRPKPYKSDSARMVQKTTVVVNCQKAVSVKPVSKLKKSKPVCSDSCSKELQQVKTELQAKDSELRKAEIELATLRERARTREAWIENYRKEYAKHNGWR